MKKRITLFKLELKRMLQTVPSMLIGIVVFVAIILAISLISYGIQNQMRHNKNVYHVAVVQHEENRYLKVAFETIQKMDALKKALTFEEVSEDKALKGIKNGTYEVAIIVPEKFVSKLMNGEDTKAKIYYGGVEDTIVSYVIKELTNTATLYLEESEKSIFGLKDYVAKYDSKKVSEADRSLAIRYISKLLARNNLFDVKHVTATDNISFAQYYTCVGIIMLFLLLGLQCAKILSGYDRELARKLNAEGVSATTQIMSKYCALICAFGILYLIILIGVILFKNELSLAAVKAILILFPISALLIFVFELVENTANAILTLFVIILGLGFVSGYFFPLSMLPESFQSISEYTITRGMLEYNKKCMLNDSVSGSLAFIIGHSVFLIFISVAIRKYRMQKSY